MDMELSKIACKRYVLIEIDFLITEEDDSEL